MAEHTSEDAAGIRQPGSVRVSVIVLTYNGRPHLPRLHAALGPLITPADELIVYDNASTDGTADWFDEHWPEARVVVSDTNLMFAAGNNAATPYASGDVVLYLSQDTAPTATVVEAAARWAAPRRAITFAQAFPWSDGPVTPYLDWSGVVLWRDPDREVLATNMLSGGAFALHRATLDELGGVPFDERIPHVCEDTNLSIRLADRGYELAALRDAVVEHDSTPSKGSALSDFGRAIVIGRNRYLAFSLSRGTADTLRRLPKLLLAGFRKSNVDGRGSVIRSLGITVASVLGYVWAILRPPGPSPSRRGGR